MPSQIPIMFAGMSRLYGHWSWSGTRRRRRGRRPATIEVPSPPTVRAISDGGSRGQALGTDSTTSDAVGHPTQARVARLEGGLPAVLDREGRGHETVEEGMRPLGLYSGGRSLNLVSFGAWW